MDFLVGSEGKDHKFIFFGKSGVNAEWLRGRASDPPLRGPVFESCAAMSNLGHVSFTRHCSSSLSCMNEYLAVDNGGYLYEQPSRINCSAAGSFTEKSRLCSIKQVRQSVKCSAP